MTERYNVDLIDAPFTPPLLKKRGRERKKETETTSREFSCSVRIYHHAIFDGLVEVEMSSKSIAKEEGE